MSNITVVGGLQDMPVPNYQYIQNTEEALRHIEFIERHPIIEVDTETTGLDPHAAKVVLLQIGVHGKAFVFDVREGNVDAIIFKPVLENTTNLKILQNAVFDYEMLKTNFGIELNRMYDLMLAEQLIYLGLHYKSSLDYLVSNYLHLNMPKDTGRSFENYNQQYQEYQLRYAANDVSVMKDIYNLQLLKLKKDNLLRAARLEFEFVKPLAEMELNGMLLDIPKWRVILDEILVERNRLSIELSDIFNRTIDQNTLFGVSLMNLDSPTQVIKSLQKLGVGVESTDVKELSKYKKNPVVKLLLDYRKSEKFITTYGEKMIGRIHPSTGRLHTSFRQMVDTGRMSSSDPNMQNIPKEQKYRACFVARPGYKLITCLSGDSKIMVEDGYKYIKDIKVGDKVFTHIGRYKKVKEIGNRISDHIYNIRTYYSPDTHKLTGEHPVLVLKSDKFHWKNVGNISKNDIVCFPVNNDIAGNNEIKSLYEDTYRIGTNKKIGRRRLKQEHLLNGDFWRLVGYWLGDGHRTKYISYFSFGNEDKKACIEDVCNISRNLFNYKPGFDQEDGCVKVRIGEKNLSHFLSKFYIKDNSGQKKLLKIIESLPMDLQTELIKGYFGADGHHYSGRGKKRFYNSAGFVSISKELLEAVQRILLRFNVITSIQKVGDKGTRIIRDRKVNVKDKYELIGSRDLVVFLGLPIEYEKVSIVNYRTCADKPVSEQTEGYCKCGCGKLTTVFYGKHRQYIHGHNGRGKPLSYEHRLSMSETRFKKGAALGIKKGFIKDGFFCFPVKSVKKIQWNKPVFNLEVDQDHSYCSHLLATHNCDMSQAELRILAEYSGDPAFLEAFEQGMDLHTRTASDLFGVSHDEIIADKKLADEDPNKKNYRGNVKALNFGLVYGLTKVGLALRMETSENEAQKLIDMYFSKYTHIRDWLDKAAKSAVLNRYSTTLSGRRRYYRLPDPSDREFNKIKGRVERAGKNHPIQGTNADTIKQSMIFVEERIKPYDARLLLTVHDEVIIEAKEEQAEEVSQVVEQCLIDGFAEFVPTVKMTADADIADYWVKG